MNRPLFISIAILVFTTIGLAWGTFMLHDAEQKEGIAGFVRVSPVINVASHQTTSLQPTAEPVVINCNDNKCSFTSSGVKCDSSCAITPSKYLKDTLLVSAIIVSENPNKETDLSWLQMEYFSASNGTNMIIAQNEMVGLYLIQKKSDSEMLFMNFFDKGVQVKIADESHNGMPDITVTNYDMTVGIYQWDGDSYELNHEERWACPA